MSKPGVFSTKTTISVLIVDDHSLFRAGLQQALRFEDDIHIIGHSESGEDALTAIPRLKPDVVLLDVNLPGLNGLQVARELKTKQVPCGIVILTAHHDSEQVLHALRTGANAYCAKDIRAEVLIEVIRDVAAGFYHVDSQRMNTSELDNWLSTRISDTAGPHTLDAEGHYIPLSPREMEILHHVTNGLINKEIAAKLGISQQTVKNHMTSILKKLNVNDRTQAAVIAIRRGWVRPENGSDSEEI